MIIINFVISPLTFEKRKNWGSPGSDIAEYYYPYNESFKWIKINFKNEKFYFTILIIIMMQISILINIRSVIFIKLIKIPD